MQNDAAALASNLRKDHFNMFELTDIMRQKDDFEIAALLNRLRCNALSDSDKEQMKRCEISKDSDKYPKLSSFACRKLFHAYL